VGKETNLRRLINPVLYKRLCERAQRKPLVKITWRKTSSPSFAAVWKVHVVGCFCWLCFCFQFICVRRANHVNI